VLTPEKQPEKPLPTDKEKQPPTAKEKKGSYFSLPIIIF